MTNSIWHKANEKPELNKYVVVRKHGFAQWKVLKFDNKTTFFEPFTDDLWAYMADVITQADKVELQADKAERLQKAVDLALERFDDIKRLYDKYYDKYSVIATETTEEIKQIIKEN